MVESVNNKYLFRCIGLSEAPTSSINVLQETSLLIAEDFSIFFTAPIIVGGIKIMK